MAAAGGSWKAGRFVPSGNTTFQKVYGAGRLTANITRTRQLDDLNERVLANDINSVLRSSGRPLSVRREHAQRIANTFEAGGFTVESI